MAGQTIPQTLARPGVGGWLLALAGGCVAYAAFANGATSIPEETRVQLALAAGLLLAGIGLFTGVVGLARSPLAWAGVGLLALFALFSAISVAWSLAPDQGWLAANRAAAYAAAVAIVLVAASSVPRAPQLALGGYVAIALAVALYALGGKLFPELSIGPIDLDHASQFSRLRDPLGYWNALGLLLVMATPACIWIAADRSRPERWRIGALLALQLLLVTIALTYSRGAVVALLAVVAVMVGAGPAGSERLRRLGVAGLATLGAVPAIAFAFSVDSLSEDGIEAADRAGDGALLAFILAVSMLAVAVAALAAINAEREVQWRPDHDRRAWGALTWIATTAVLVGLIALAASDRGPAGSISHAWDEFRDPIEASSNTPGRLLSGSGSNRWIWWSEATGAFSDRPLAGWGAGSFPTLHILYSEHRTQVRSTHEVPLQFLSETGLLGAAVALGGLVLLALAAVRETRQASGADRAARLALLALAAAWGLHSLYDWDWEIPAVTLPALAAMAIAAAPQRPALIRYVGRPKLVDSAQAAAVAHRLVQSRGRARRPPLDAHSPAAVPAILVASLIAVSLTISAALPSLSRDKLLSAQRAAATAEDDDRIDAAVDEALAAGDLNPVAVEPLIAAAALEGGRGDLARREELLLEATRLQPYSFRAWNHLLAHAFDAGDAELVGAVLPRWLEVSRRAFPDARVTYSNLISWLLMRADSSPTAVGTPPPGR